MCGGGCVCVWCVCVCVCVCARLHVALLLSVGDLLPVMVLLCLCSRVCMRIGVSLWVVLCLLYVRFARLLNTNAHCLSTS